MYKRQVPITIYILIIHSARCEEEEQNLAQANLKLKKLRKEADFQLKQLQKIQSGEQDTDTKDEGNQVRAKEKLFEIYRTFFPKILELRFKREIPPLLREAAIQGFGVDCGVILEIPSQKTGQVQIRAHWGFQAPGGIEALLAPFTQGEMIRETSDNKTSLEPEAIKRKPLLFEEFDNFSEVVFPPVQLLPIVIAGKTVFVLSLIHI